MKKENKKQDNKGIFDKNFKEIISFEFLSIIGGLIAGTILSIYTNNLLLIPGMLILLPGFLAMRGDISGAFASRLSSGLFLKVIKPDNINTKLIRGNLAASFFLALFASLVLGLIAFFFNYVILQVFVVKIIFISLVAGIIANAVDIMITLFLTFYLFRKGHDPNNIMGPLLTSVGDIVGVISLLIALVIL